MYITLNKCQLIRWNIAYFFPTIFLNYTVELGLTLRNMFLNPSQIKSKVGIKSFLYQNPPFPKE